MPNKSSFILSFVLVALVLLFLFVVFLGKAGIIGNLISDRNDLNPILKIHIISISNFEDGEKCFSSIRGNVANEGSLTVKNVMILCETAVWPMTNQDKKESFLLDELKSGEEYEFNIDIKKDCGSELRFFIQWPYY